MRGVAGQWAVEVKLDGRDLYLEPSTINSINLISNIHQHLPSFYLSFKDKTGEIMKNPPVDGMSVSVSIGLPDNMYSGQFRVIGNPDVDPVNSVNNISFKAVLDKIGWMKKAVDRAYPGTASSVIAQIASQAGLIPDVDSTNDNMIWLPNKTSLVQYARHVTARAFSSDTSAMMLATTLSGKVRFKDIDKIIQGAAGALMTQTGEGLPLLYASAASKSDAANSAQGYGSTSVGVNEDGSIFKGNKVNLRMLSSKSPISSFMKGAIGELGSKIVNFAPLSGNTHENWYKALHQNPRIKSSYAFDIYALTNVNTNLELLDLVDIRPLDMPTLTEASALAGKYIVSAISKTIVQGRFLEKIVGTSQSIGGV